MICVRRQTDVPANACPRCGAPVVDGQRFCPGCGRQAIALAIRASQPRAELMARTLVGWAAGVIGGRLEEAERENAEALRLARALGAKRFEAQIQGVTAVLAHRCGDHERARGLAQAAIAVCREHGMGHIGPRTHGVCALVESDRDARIAWLEAGERQLALGCVSHNHIQLRELAIDVLLELGDVDGVEQQCAAIAAYTANTANESLPMSEFSMPRGRALARFGRGERSQGLLDDLRALRSTASQSEMNTLLATLGVAIAAFDASSR